MPSSRGSSQPRIEPRSTLQVDSLPSEPPGKPNNYMCICIYNMHTHIHYITLAWKIPWTKEPRMLQSMGLLRVGHD